MVLRLVAACIVATAPLIAGTPAAAGDTGPFATVHRFVDSFNRGDNKMALSTCASPAFIIDEFPPHRWYGSSACVDWSHDLDAANRRAGITDGILTLGRPWHVDVTGDRAYVVVPVTYRYKQRGAIRIERDSVFTLALARGSGGWRIAAWAWAKR